MSEARGIPDKDQIHEPHATDEAWLLAWLAGRDAPCPVCGYNLRDLPQAACPECNQTIRLTVGATRPPMGCFLLTAAPGVFSGIAAFLLAIPIIVVPLTEGGSAPWIIVGTDAFGWISGILTIVLFRHRYAFMAMSMNTQRMCVALAWIVHIVALALFIILAARL